MTSQTRQKIIAIHISPNISRSKGKQAVQLGQSIRYNAKKLKKIKTIFLEG